MITQPDFVGLLVKHCTFLSCHISVIAVVCLLLLCSNRIEFHPGREFGNFRSEKSVENILNIIMINYKIMKG
jgi:hypothetical protein